MLGGAIVESVGFPRLMLAMGVLNLIFCPLILILKVDDHSAVASLEKTPMTFFSSKRYGYSRFEDEELEYSAEKH